MGLTTSSTGSNLINSNFTNFKNNCDFTIALCGNPNVGKSTIFNSLTGMHQHTGNWPGKTVSNACGICNYNDKKFLLVDIPGTYSLMSNSEEEEIARDFICFENPDVTIVVVDATCLERNLNLVFQTMEITKNIIVCVNLLDEAKKKNIKIDLKSLENYLGVPVVGTTAKNKKTIKLLLNKILDICISKEICNPNLIKYNEDVEKNVSSLYKLVIDLNTNKNTYINRWICLKLLEGDSKIINSISEKFDINLNIPSIKNELNKIYSKISKEYIKDILVRNILKKSEEISKNVCTYKNADYNARDRKIDKVLTSKKWAVPIMLAFLCAILWITIVGANYPTILLNNFFNILQNKLEYLFDILHIPIFLKEMLLNGLFKTVTWIISVMLPPMAIFFPLFTLLEDLGILPRIAFNLDNYFKKACTSGKQALTMCMGLGCNAAGVVGCRIIDSPREKLIAMLTNALIPCNGRFPILITISTIFIGSFFTGIYSSIISTLCICFIILLGIILTLLISKLLSKTILSGIPSSFILELPPYRKPQIGKILIRSLLDRTLFVLGRAITVAAPVGIIIWIFANVSIGRIIYIILYSKFLGSFCQSFGARWIHINCFYTWNSC